MRRSVAQIYGFRTDVAQSFFRIGGVRCAGRRGLNAKTFVGLNLQASVHLPYDRAGKKVRLADEVRNETLDDQNDPGRSERCSQPGELPAVKNAQIAHAPCKGGASSEKDSRPLFLSPLHLGRRVGYSS